MIHDDATLSLFDVSTRLGLSPSAIKKRVVQLNLPVQRGARGKLIFDRHAYGLLMQADELLKAGHGFEECRRRLGLEAPARPAIVMMSPAAAAPDAEAAPIVSAPQAAAAAEVESPAADEAPWPAASGQLEEPQSLPGPDRAALRATLAEAIAATGPLVPPIVAPLAAAATPPADVAAMPPAIAPPASHEPASGQASPTPTTEPLADTAAMAAEPHIRHLPPPVMVQLGRKASRSPAPPPDLVSRLDSALKMLEDKERHNQMLQSKLLVAYDEMTKLSATAAAFQERSLNLAHEVQKLQGELKMLDAPERKKPWWKFWA